MKTIRKLKLSRETLRRLDITDVRKLPAGFYET